MKKFIYKIKNFGVSKYGGRYQKGIIYKISKNDLQYIGETRKWNTASYRGADNEVNDWLLENKIIPKTWSITFYYCKNEKYEIKEI